MKCQPLGLAITSRIGLAKCCISDPAPNLTGPRANVGNLDGSVTGAGHVGDTENVVRFVKQTVFGVSHLGGFEIGVNVAGLALDDIVSKRPQSVLWVHQISDNE